MKNNPNIPNELYYLDEQFSTDNLRKYQLKEILTSNNIPYLQTITRNDLVKLYKKHIEPRREEIIREFKLKEQRQKEEEAKTVFGRGHRTTHKPKKFENTVFQATRKTTTTVEKRRPVTRNTAINKDKDGFAIPAIPKKKRVTFTAEDSFGEEEEEDEVKSDDRRKIAIKLPMSSDVTTRKSTRQVKKEVEEKEPKASSSSFNPEDSFASSDDSVGKRQARKRVLRQRTPKINQDIELEDKKANLKAIEQHFENVDRSMEKEEEDDLNYQADSDVSDEELALLEKEPVEALVSTNSTLYNNSVLLWNRILTSEMLVYMAVVIICYTIYLCTSQEKLPY